MLTAPTSTLLAARTLSRPPALGTRPLPSRVGRYLLFDHVGRGGMADIYLARVETELGGSRRVIVKEVLPKHAENSVFSAMLVAEAKLAAGLSHANVVTVEDLGREGGALYIAMEYVEGFDLRELCRRCSQAGVPLPIEFSLFMVMETLRGLDYAHRKKLVHRDVSPSNVLISFEGEVKICDFGIARANAESELDEETVRGKAGYMSPEHARGGDVDARADVYAAGIILWELLSGRRYYRAAQGEKLIDVARRAEQKPLISRGLPKEKELHNIVYRALEIDREVRYQTAGAMLRDLEAYATRSGQYTSPLRFGEWLMERFGAEIVELRRTRERAAWGLTHKALPRVMLPEGSPIPPPVAPVEIRKTGTFAKVAIARKAKATARAWVAYLLAVAAATVMAIWCALSTGSG
ncbi:MAG: serine/threonine protein kinase [Polyangiaceae bacterium]|nr:serine/threonine protein kinase [Polyangiaceae bacterium]